MSKVLLLTGSAGGGKSHLGLEKINGYCLKYPGSFALIIRKVKNTLTSGAVLAFEDGVIVSKKEDKKGGVIHKSYKSQFVYGNGSIAVYLGMKDKDEIEKIKSIGRAGGVDIAFMEEATQFTERDFNAVLARMRGKAGTFRQLILACNPDAPTHWIHRRLILNGEASIYYSGEKDNPHNPRDYVDTLNSLTGVDHERLTLGKWSQAQGLVYGVWEDKHPAKGGNVTDEADYVPGGGPVYWFVDQGYAGEYDYTLGTFKADAHPRVFLWAQMRGDGRLCIFNESYAVQTLRESHLQTVMEINAGGGYPHPDSCATDNDPALRAFLMKNGYYMRGKKPASVSSSIDEVREWIGKDKNGYRRILVHPRCRHLRLEMASYRWGQGDKPIKEFDHGPDALRYGVWALRWM